MKKFLLIVILVLAAYQFSFSWEKADRLSVLCIANAYNDSDIVVVNKISTYQFALIYVDLTTGKCTNQHLDLPNTAKITGAAINANSKSAAFLSEGNIYIYNFKTMTQITVIKAVYDYTKDSVKLSFSKDGSNIYLLNKDELRIIVYNAATGSMINNTILITNPAKYTDAVLYPEKDEFALVRNDSLEIWSLTSMSIMRNIPIDSGALNVQFRLGGDQISYATTLKSNSDLPISFNDVYVITSLTGAKLYHKTDIENFDYFEFSSDMKYLVYNYRCGFQRVWDVQLDRCINYIPNTYWACVPQLYTIYYRYISADFKKGLGFEANQYECNTNHDLTEYVNVYYVYDFVKDVRLNSVPDGYVNYPTQMILDDQSKLISIWGMYNNKYMNTFMNSLVTTSGDFIKYINSIKPPIAFTPDDNYLLLLDSSTVLFYNIAGDSIEKSLKAVINSTSQYFFIPSDTLMVIPTSNKIYIYNYNDLSLKQSVDLSALGITTLKMFCDQNHKLNYYANSKFYAFDPITGVSTERVLTNVPQRGVLYDVSPDGDHILYMVYYDSLFVYDINAQKVIYNYITTAKEPIGQFGCGFLGNYQLIWYSCEYDPILETRQFFEINLNDGSTSFLQGDLPVLVSRDGLHYGTISCPEIYYYNDIPKTLSVDESKPEATNDLIYPNPAQDFINFNIGSIYSSNIQVNIYNELGIPVYEKAFINDGMNTPLQIETKNFSDGVYYCVINTGTNRITKSFIVLR